MHLAEVRTCLAPHHNAVVKFPDLIVRVPLIKKNKRNALLMWILKPYPVWQLVHADGIVSERRGINMDVYCCNKWYFIITTDWCSTPRWLNIRRSSHAQLPTSSVPTVFVPQSATGVIGNRTAAVQRVSIKTRNYQMLVALRDRSSRTWPCVKRSSLKCWL